MNGKSILIVRDRPRLQLRNLVDAGIQLHWTADLHEARDEFNRLSELSAVIVDMQQSVERGLEFCEIVHMLRPAVIILFVRSALRPSVEPRCAHRVLDPEVTESDLEKEILLLLEKAPAPPGRRSA